MIADGGEGSAGQRMHRAVGQRDRQPQALHAGGVRPAGRVVDPGSRDVLGASAETDGAVPGFRHRHDDRVRVVPHRQRAPCHGGPGVDRRLVVHPGEIEDPRKPLGAQLPGEAGTLGNRLRQQVRVDQGQQAVGGRFLVPQGTVVTAAARRSSK